MATLLALGVYMKPLAYLCFLTFMAMGSASAAVVTYSGVSVSCISTNHPLTTETLSISFDNTANGGKISGGAIGTNSCAFQLTNQVVFPPFVNGLYTYNGGVAGNQDTVCWAVGFCNGPTTTDTLVIVGASPTGASFTINSGSITTTFTIASAVPEPGELALAGASLLGLVGLLRKRQRVAVKS
jgi:hypothetical protein